MNSESDHEVIKVSKLWLEKTQGEERGGGAAEYREKMKWVLFRLQAEKEQYEEK